MKYLLILIALLGLLISCGKKGPIDLPTGYTDDRIPQVVKLDPPIVPEVVGTHIQKLAISRITYLWMGYSNNRGIRAMIEYPLTSVTDLNLSVTTLSLSLKIDDMLISEPMTFHCYRLTKAWREGNTTWLNSDTSVTWTIPGGDYTTLSSFQITVNPTDTEINITDEQLRPFVTYWLDHPDENYGFIIIPDDIPGSEKNVEIISLVTTADSDVTLHPVLKYTVGSTNKTISPSQMMHFYNDTGVVEANDPLLFVLGDGYLPMFSLDLSEFLLHPEREILQAKLTVHGEPDVLTHVFRFDEPSDANNKLYIAAGTPNIDGTLTITHTLLSNYSFSNGNVVLDMTGLLKLVGDDEFTYMIIPFYNGTMLRYSPMTIVSFEVFYRDQISEN